MDQPPSKIGIAFVGSIIILVFAVFLVAGFKNVLPSRDAQKISKSGAQSISSQKTSGHIESDFAYYTGPANAKVTVVEFLDFQCPYCQQVHSTVKNLLARYADKSVKFVFRQFPIEKIHPVALDAARASLCAKEQNKFQEIVDLFYAKQDQISIEALPLFAQSSGVPDIARFSSCLASHRYDGIIRNDQSDGINLGIQGTPTFFINGEKIEGAQEEQIFIDAIDSALIQ